MKPAKFARKVHSLHAGGREVRGADSSRYRPATLQKPPRAWHANESCALGPAVFERMQIFNGVVNDEDRMLRVMSKGAPLCRMQITLLAIGAGCPTKPSLTPGAFDV